MALDPAPVISTIGLAAFWTGFWLGHYHGGREEARRQLLKLEKRRELDKIKYEERCADTETKNKFWEWYASGQKPRHVRIQTPGESASSEGKVRWIEPEKEPQEG